MAIVRCAECGNEISDKALTCPKCGAPQASSCTSPAGTSAKPKAKTHPVTMGIAIALVAIAIGSYAWQQHESSLPKLPVTVEYRSAILERGLVFVFRDGLDSPISVVATFKRPSTGVTLSREVYISPKFPTSIGGHEGWIGQSGDTIELKNNNYQTWSGAIP
jgi:zinc-ribbon domain